MNVTCGGQLDSCPRFLPELDPRLPPKSNQLPQHDQRHIPPSIRKWEGHGR